MSDLIGWLRLQAETPGYLPAIERQKFSDSADALEQAQIANKNLHSVCNEYETDIKVNHKCIEQLEAALHPGKQSCDCCTRQQYKGETFWMIECQCGNHDDIGRAQAWCSMANSYEGATGKSVAAGDSKL